MAKIITISEAAKLVTDNSSIMFGGFLPCGVPHDMIDELVVAGPKNLTSISNDHCLDGRGLSRLVASGQITKSLVTHVGTNPQSGNLMDEGKLELQIIPQGTLAERIRAGGAGLGAILTQTGVGTVVEEGKQKLIINGVEYLVEEALKADFAIIHAHSADKAGNLIYRGTARNFNPIMATAATTVIAEVENIIDGYFDPDTVHTQSILVDYLVKV